MLKYSIKLLLYTHQPNSKGQYPIYIRITINRKQVYIATGHFIDTKFWDTKAEQVKSGHMLAGTINIDLTTRKQNIIKRIVDYQVKGAIVTASQIKAELSHSIDNHNLFEFADKFIAEVRHKRRPGTLENYRKHLKVVELFNGSRLLSFEQINHQWLVRFEDYLRNPIKEGVTKRDSLGGNYIYIIFKTLKTFFNAARKRGLITCYPFDIYENPEYTAPVKDYLTLAELDQLEKLLERTTNATLKQTLLFFLLGCYSGLRLSDWRQFDYNTHVKESRLRLRAKKNGEWVTMPVIGRLARHLERLRGIRLSITEQEINRTLKNIGGIKKKISSHTGRHTFAITMCCEMGIGAEVTAELMGITIATCVENYYRITARRIERDVINAWK